MRLTALAFTVTLITSESLFSPMQNDLKRYMLYSSPLSDFPILAKKGSSSEVVPSYEEIRDIETNNTMRQASSGNSEAESVISRL